MSKVLERISGFANRNFAEHQLKTRLDQGLFRQYRCTKPDTWVYGFDVTFTPGWVFLTGDIGHLALNRAEDMMPWLRGVLKRDQIDLRYVAEKAPRNIVTREWTSEAATSLLDCICQQEFGDGIDYEERLSLYEFTNQSEWENVTIPKLIDLGVHHFYEYGDPQDWTAGFIWCVLGLQWFVRAFDAVSLTCDSHSVSGRLQEAV